MISNLRDDPKSLRDEVAVRGVCTLLRPIRHARMNAVCKHTHEHTRTYAYIIHSHTNTNINTYTYTYTYKNDALQAKVR